MIGQNPEIVKALPGRRIRHGLVLGKFMPPTEGHLYLIGFARESCEKLTVVVGTLPDEPIPGRLRYEWIREIFPDAHVVHLDKVMPQAPAHPDDRPFFNLWAEALHGCCGGDPPSALFASEDYGYKVADAMGIRFIPVDTARESVGISGTDMRNDPFRNWDRLHPVVRPYYLKRIALLGAGSAEKNALARALAAHFGTKYAADYREKLVGDFVRNLPSFNASMLTPADLEAMARGQIASEGALARQSRRILLSCLDLRSLCDWGRQRFGAVPDWIATEAESPYDLYLLPKDAASGWWTGNPPPNLALLQEPYGNAAIGEASGLILRQFPGLAPDAGG